MIGERGNGSEVGVISDWYGQRAVTSRAENGRSRQGHCQRTLSFVLGDGKVRDGLTVTRNENRDDETVLCDGSASDKMDGGVRDIVKVYFDGNDVRYR